MQGWILSGGVILFAHAQTVSQASTVFSETTRFFEYFFFELGADMGEPLLKPRIGFWPKGSLNQIVACVNTSVYRAQLENKPPIHYQSSLFGAVTFKAYEFVPG